VRHLYRPAIVIALALMVLGAWLWKRERQPEFTSPGIVTQVQQLSQLATVRYTVQKIIGLKEQKSPVGSESILLIVQARVEAGIDLGSMRPDDVILRRDGAVVVRLPDPKILNAFIDEKETKVWDREKTWWTPWVPFSLDLEHRARLAGLDAATKAALDMGILTQAQRNAETSIRVTLQLAGHKSVTVVPRRLS
jgi:hypothetical protein